MKEFRGNTVLTFDTECKGAIVLEHMDDSGPSIQRWLEKNLSYIDFVIPIDKAIVSDPVQAMFCGTIARMHQALATLAACDLQNEITVLRTEYPLRDLSIVDILNQGCSKGHAGALGQVIGVSRAKRSWLLETITTTSRCLPLQDIHLSWEMRPMISGGRDGTLPFRMTNVEWQQLWSRC